jgi:hypothetical protein
MATSVTSQPTVATGDTIEAAYSNTNRDNVAILDTRTGGDPGAADLMLVSTGPLAASWVAKASAIGYTPVNKAGDTMTGDLSVTRTATPTQGYLILGNNTGRYLGFNGSVHVFETPKLEVHNDLQVYRASATTTGYVILGSDTGHFIGFDGTNVVTEGGTVITTGNDGTLCNAATAASATTATTATSATTATTATSATTATTATSATTATTANAIADGAVSSAGKISDGIITLGKMHSSASDASAGTPSLRSLGTGANNAAAGNHTHGTISGSGTYTGNGGGARTITGSLGFQPRLVVVSWSAGAYMMNASGVWHGGSDSTPWGTFSGGSIDANGFTVPSGLNISPTAYTWSAFA